MSITKLLLIILMTTGIFQKANSQDYFQQEVNYKIDVTLNDRMHELSAFEKIQYINNSPDTLQLIYFHLWPNGYSSNKTDLARQLFNTRGKERLFKDPELQGFIDSLDFKINDSLARWEYLAGQPDICRIFLDNPLLPGDSIIITTPFHVKIPLGVTSRLGHIGESYQISQWYPKPAVYDRTGWHQMPYLDQGEFYAEFGSFDVSITLPDNYIVGATGNLHNDRELKVLENLAADTTWINAKKEKFPNVPISSKRTKTLQYKEKNIHDFAWFADKQFHVIKGSVRLPQSGKEVTTWVMFTDEQSDLWKKSISYVNQAVFFFSNLIGDYPYNNFTAVQSALNAGSGMEYPGITVIGLVKNGYTLDEVIAHEIGHNWFYGALGSDERRYPFMDEGVTSLYEKRYMNHTYPGKKLWEIYIKKLKLAKFLHVEKLPVQRMQELEWLTISRRSLEQPLNLNSTDYSSKNYGMIIYDKAAAGFNYLRAYLGDSLFDSSMQNYYENWKFRHPQPDDLRNVFESTTGKDLSWFFDDFLGTTKRLDYKIVRLKNRELVVANNGEMNSPWVLSGMKGDSICFQKWFEGFKGLSKIEIPSGNYTELKIDPLHLMPELYRLNNNIRTTGLFRKADAIRTQFYFSIEDPDKRTLMYVPSINWNQQNGLMLGITFHNGFLLPKPIEYFAMPFISINTGELAGYGKIAYNITPYDKFFRLATISLEGTQYKAPGDQNFRKIKTGIEVHFREIKINSTFKHKVFGYYMAASDLYQIEKMEKATMLSYFQVGYTFEQTKLVNPYSLSANLETGKSFQKASVEFNYKYSYFGQKNGLDIRMYAGTMLKSSSAIPFYNLSPNARSGRNLYLYQGNFGNRFGEFPKDFSSRQMYISEGGLVSPVSDKLGFSKWLMSISLTSSLPGKASRVPIKPFANILLNDHGFTNDHTSPLFYEAGFKAGIWDLFEVYFPIFVSNNMSSENGSIKERIRFVLSLNFLNQVKLKPGNGK